MAAKSYSRGWPIEWDGAKWIYSDIKTPQNDQRRCARCGKPPTTNGHDACLGFIPGVSNACCGHGQTDRYEMKVHLVR